jgi:hypothetical protein
MKWNIHSANPNSAEKSNIESHHVLIPPLIVPIDAPRQIFFSRRMEFSSRKKEVPECSILFTFPPLTQISKQELGFTTSK